MEPVTAVTPGSGVSRERAIRAIQMGALIGERKDGRWYCDPEDLARFAAEGIRDHQPAA